MPSAPGEEKLLSGLIFLIVLITSLGSNNKLYPSMNNLFLALPYMYWQFTGSANMPEASDGSG